MTISIDQAPSIQSHDSGICSHEVKDSKLGTFTGVFVPCLLTLFGVVIFLRLGWVVGKAGIFTALVIITMSTIISMISTLSMATIATNIQVGKGGVYYIISRSLGLEIGSAVGIPLYLKQALSIAFCVVGFSESLHDLFPLLPIRSIGIGTLTVLTGLAYTSVKGALKIQVVILGVLIASFLSLFTGGDPRPAHPNTFTPNAVETLGFWALFAIFFPAMTGVESIVSLSGDLKKPRRSLPLGAIGATIVCYLAYVAVAIFLAKNVSRERLANDALIMQDVARIPSLIVLGIWGATLSSALGELLAAPRTLQAIANDGVLPKFLGKGFGKTEQPHIATFCTFALTFAAVYLGSINAIAPLMTMICLVCYGVLNLSAGFETLIANPSWRPSFPVHWSLSLTGALLCLICMLMIDAGVALISLLAVTIIYLVVKRYMVQKSWEDIRSGILLYLCRYTMYRLAAGHDTSKSWRPHFLVFSKTAERQSVHLLKFFQAISKSKGFITVASFLSKATVSREKQHQLAELMTKRFQEKNIQSFVHIRETEKATVDMQYMIKHYGLGPLKPNTVVLGALRESNEADEFVKVIQSAHTHRYNTILMIDDLHSEKEVQKTSSDEIHVWWDDRHEENSELMLIFSYMLQRQSLVSKDKICIKAVIHNERGRSAKKAQFEALGEKLRLQLEVDLYVAQESSLEEFISLVKCFSKDAKSIFLSLRPPPAEGEPREEYAHYLRVLPKQVAPLQDVAMVLSSEHTPLDKILQ